MPRRRVTLLGVLDEPRISGTATAPAKTASTGAHAAAGAPAAVIVARATAVTIAATNKNERGDGNGNSGVHDSAGTHQRIVDDERGRQEKGRKEPDSRVAGDSLGTLGAAGAGGAVAERRRRQPHATPTITFSLHSSSCRSFAQTDVVPQIHFRSGRFHFAVRPEFFPKDLLVGAARK